MKAAGKGLDKSRKKQIKNSSSQLRKLIGKCRLDKVDEQELQTLRDAIDGLKKSAEELEK